MTVVRRHVTIHASLSGMESAWERFVDHVLTKRERLACTALVCVDAVRHGMVRFTPDGDATRASFQLDLDEGQTIDEEEIGRRLMHDLLVFKDHVERGAASSGSAGRRHQPDRAHRDGMLDPGDRAQYWRP